MDGAREHAVRGLNRLGFENGPSVTRRDFLNGDLTRGRFLHLVRDDRYPLLDDRFVL
jgi:hypothetical protein